MPAQTRLTSHLLAANRILAVTTIATTFIGAWKAYTGIPFWDMWDGYIDFYLRVTNGDASAWGAQHNEHRLILSRLLFYIDLRWLGGLSLLPLSANMVAMAALWATLVTIWRKIAPTNMASDERDAVSWMLGTTCFSWAQHDNITIGFQIQFFLAYLLPLLSFMFLARYAEQPERSGRFWIAVGLGAACIGTMANGVAAPILLCVLALALHLPMQRSALAVLIAVIAVGSFFVGYMPANDGGSLLHVWLHAPFRAAWFAFVFLGSMLTQLGAGVGVAGCAGLLLFVAAGLATYHRWRGVQRAPMYMALGMFLTYIVFAAMATAGGRARAGLGMALAERYATPSMLAFSSAALLGLVVLRAQRRTLALASCTAFCALQLIAASHALREQDWRVFPMRLAALALSLGVNDPVVSNSLYPDENRLLAIANNARDHHLSIFAAQPWRDVATAIGKPVTAFATLRDCGARLDNTNSSALDSRAWRVLGSLPDANTESRVLRIWLVDPEQRIIGIALPGNPKLLDALIDAEELKYTGFSGYALIDPTGSRAWCEFKS